MGEKLQSQKTQGKETGRLQKIQPFFLPTSTDARGFKVKSKIGSGCLQVTVIVQDDITCILRIRVRKNIVFHSHWFCWNKNCSVIILFLWSMSCKDHLRSTLHTVLGKHLRGKYFYPSLLRAKK